MKFAALALALLLAVSSQAASIQQNTPSELAPLWSAAQLSLNTAKTAVENALNKLDDPSQAELKQQLLQKMEDIYKKIQTSQEAAAAYGDAAAVQVMEMTKSFREKVSVDITQLRSEIESERQQAVEAIQRHLDEYTNLVRPIFDEFSVSHKALMESLWPKVLEVVAALKTNWEETKSHLIPMAETIRAKVEPHINSGRETIRPYIIEYKEQIRQAYTNAQAMNQDKFSAVVEKVKPNLHEIAGKLQEIGSSVYETYMQ